MAHLVDYSAGLSHSEKNGETTLQPQRQWLSEQLAALPRPLGIVLEDDRFAEDAIEAAALLGWRIPEDLAVLG